MEFRRRLNRPTMMERLNGISKPFSLLFLNVRHLRLDSREWEHEQDRRAFNILTILFTILVYLCRTATSCMQRLDNLQTARSDASTVVVISTSPEKEQRNSIQRQARSPSPRSSSGATQPPEDLDGLSFLRHVVTEKRDHHCFAKVTPIIMLENANPITTGRQTNNGSTPDRGRQPSNTILNQRAVAHNSQYLGLGAADVLQSPLSVERAQCLPAHAFKTCQDAQRTQGSGSAPTSRKASWVGVNETKPYAYLRESMVSGLMDRICDPEYPEKLVDPR